MAKPKLCLIPAAQGSKLYSVLPSSGVGDFQFNRSGSATRINSQGLIETVASGVSRLNYPMIDGVVKGCPHHILEPQRLQKLQYSEDFSQSIWTKSNCTISSNQAISPDGILNSDKIIVNNGSSLSSISNYALYQLTKSASAIQYTYSLFVKEDGLNRINLIAQGSSISNNASATFSVSDGLVVTDAISAGSFSNASASVDNYGNGFFRLNLTFTTNTETTLLIRNIPTDSTLSVGNGTSGIYIWGAMLEEGSYPTSYIPNYGTGAGVTRSAETANGSGDASTFNDSEGVLMAEISKIDISQSLGSLFLMKDLNNSIRLNFSTSNRFNFFVKVGGFNQVDFDTYDYELEDYNKILVSYKLNEYSLWFNGYKIFTDTNATVSSGLNELKYNDFYGSTKQLQYFDTALNSEDLEKLTSWVSFQDMAEGQLYSVE